MSGKFQNPFRPGAGHPPPYLAGREKEKEEFIGLLGQNVITDNMILTGLRGTGKTALLDSFKRLAIDAGWKWAGTDLSEAATISEESMAERLLADLSVVTSEVTARRLNVRRPGFADDSEPVNVRLDYGTLRRVIYDETPGLVPDKLKVVIETAWELLEESGAEGLVFACDEAQNLFDKASGEQFPAAVLLDVFQSLQKKGNRVLLVLTGLPALFPKLAKARAYSERMFRVVEVGRLSAQAGRDAVTKPMEDASCPVRLTDESVDGIVELSGGYPYLIQFICREVYDAFLRGSRSVPKREIPRKLDSDFFTARWTRATDRQKDLLTLAAFLDGGDEEFTVRDVVALSNGNDMGIKSFSPSHAGQMLSTLTDVGLVYKNRRGKYALAVPLMRRFIRRKTGTFKETGADE